MTDHDVALAEQLALDRAQAEELQDRMRREEQTARALREYLLRHGHYGAVAASTPMSAAEPSTSQAV